MTRAVQGALAQAIIKAAEELGFKDKVESIECWIKFEGWPNAILINYPTHTRAAWKKKKEGILNSRH